MPVQRAASFAIKFCPHCNDPHIILLDGDGKPFAQAIIHSEFGREFIENIQTILYLRATGEEGDDQVG